MGLPKLAVHQLSGRIIHLKFFIFVLVVDIDLFLDLELALPDEEYFISSLSFFVEKLPLVDGALRKHLDHILHRVSRELIKHLY